MAAKNKTWKLSRNSNWARLLKSKATSLSPQLCRIRVYCVISIAGKDLPNEHPMADLLQSDFLLSPLALPWGPPLMPPILRRRPLPAMDLPICQIFPEAVLQIRCMMYINLKLRWSTYGSKSYFMFQVQLLRVQ